MGHRTLLDLWEKIWKDLWEEAELPYNVTFTTTPQDFIKDQKQKEDNKLKRFIFFFRWHWRNRKWSDTRQKQKRALEDYELYKQGKPCRYL